MANGFVYLFSQNDTTYYKIGMTTSDSVKSRFASFCTYSPNGANIDLIIPTTNPLKIEKELHKKFSHKRLHGEFFNLSNEDIDVIKKTYLNKFQTKLKNCFDLLYEKCITEDVEEYDALNIIRHVKYLIDKPIDKKKALNKDDFMSPIFTYMENLNLKEMDVAPVDIQEKFYPEISTHKISRILSEYGFQKNGVKRYTPFSNETAPTKPGRPFKINCNHVEPTRISPTTTGV